jgi:hypothetical protein
MNSSTEHPVTDTSLRAEDVLPEGVRRAREAFLRDFAKLIADPKTRGKWICYHADKLVAVHADYVALIRSIRDVSGDASLIFHVGPAAEAEEQAIAEERELP